jgi:hypothetical protein
MGTLLRPTPYFDAQVVEQMVAFSRSIGVGHGLGAILTLPWTLFVAAQPGVYSGGFGFAVGPLYLAAIVAALVVPEGRGRALAAAGLLTLAWFFTSQEARYLLPALMLFALAGGIAFDTLAARSRAIWLLPAIAVALTQAPLVATIPARAAVALGPLSSDDFAERDDAARLGAQLRATLPPDARVLLVLESRSFYFRGLDFIPYHVLEGSPVVRMVHDAPDPHALRCRLAALDVSDVVVNLAEVRRFHPVPVPGYGAAEYAADLHRLRAFLDEWAQPFARQGGAVAARLRPINDCTGVSAPGAPLPKTL